jgi:hypothetical protein
MPACGWNQCRCKKIEMYELECCLIYLYLTMFKRVNVGICRNGVIAVVPSANA